MANTKISALTQLTTPAVDDYIPIVDKSTMLTKYITPEDLEKIGATELTIASDAITVTQKHHKLQPESGTTDNLSTISGTANGQSGVLYCSDYGTDTITIKHNVGNIICPGAADITLSNGCIFWYSDGTKVYMSGGGGGTSSTSSVSNIIVNGGFNYFQRITPATPVAMTDLAYNAPDMWYSLVQGANATIGRAAGIGTSPYACKLIAGGTTNRYGIAYIAESSNSLPFRGRTVIAQCRIKPVNNAGSGTRKYRIAIIEWTGTADTGISAADLVADWTSSTFTTAGFFSSTTKTLVGTATVTATHNVETVLSVSGTVSASCNNLIVFIWTEDVPTHASDYVLIGEAGLYDGTTVQPWQPRLTGQELSLCMRFYEKNIPVDTMPTNNVTYTSVLYTNAVAAANAFRALVNFKVTKFASPTLNFYRSSLGTTDGRWNYLISGAAWYPTGNVTVDATNETGFYTAMGDNGTNHPTDYYTYQMTGVWTAKVEL